MVTTGLSRLTSSPTNSGAFVANVASSACEPGANDCDALRPGGGPGSRRSRGTWMGFVVSVTGLKKRR